MSSPHNTTAPPGPAVERATVRDRGSVVERKRQRWGWVFVAPFGLVFLGFMVVPLAYAFWMSLHSSTLAGGESFTGLANYATAFSDPIFIEGVLRVLAFVVVMVPIQIGLALVAALMLDVLATRLAKLSRLLIFIPYAIPGMIGALMWSFLYSPRFGPAQDIFGLFGATAPDFLASNMIFASLVNIVTWQWTGYFMIIIFAALRGIDPAVHEAARIDGASGIQTATRIKIPMVSATLVLVVVFSLIGTLQFFTEPHILRSAAQGAIPSSYTPNMYAFSLAFSFNQFNYASTISFALGVVVFIGSYAFMFLTRRQSGLK